ncbi:NST1 [[Candida] subhashii]|uniref:NST1 n=1 Tax=[Candida] subhashii TaxID=561895 RepID=A0A8J5Q8D5_9ASCO|nr:NST1 [[Candida] subhashii]KAG7661431.1 NST1 [[Candida] subhashii]
MTGVNNKNKEDNPSWFKLGDDIQFVYDKQQQQQSQQQQTPSPSNPPTTTNQQQQQAPSIVHTSTNGSKKKKKKNKRKNKLSPVEAHLNNPEDDYPTSRVIKQAPNGDVIVESLDTDETSGSHNHHHQHQHNHNHLHPHPPTHSKYHSPTIQRPTHHPESNLWDSASIEEQERLKEFWESLDVDDFELNQF